MDRSILGASMYDLLRKTSTHLPGDIYDALVHARQSEETGTIANDILGTIVESADLSETDNLPICQDTGTLLAVIRGCPGKDFFAIESAIREALSELTREGILRQNCVDTVTEKNTGNNIGAHVPQIHFIPADGPTEVRVMLKGGGSENMSTQYSLPHEGLKAGRDFEGVRRCILDAVFHAQGKGCAPGILGVCIGGDRASGYLLAKEQLFRRLDDRHQDDAIANLEESTLELANSLGIGPMGLGGNTTLLGIKIGTAGRHPACYFVTASYSCWATRRYCVVLNDNGGITAWR